VTNIGATASSSPITLNDVVTASSTVNYTGAGGTLPISCSPGAQVINGVPINCTANTSLAPGASGTALFSFTMPNGGQFQNCATATSAQNAASAPDSNSANNTNICTTLQVTAPPPPPAPDPQDLSVTKVCEINGAQSILCTVTVTNIGATASSSPISLTDLVTGSSPVNLTGGGGTLPISCTPGAQQINGVPINCTANTSLAPGASGTALFSFTMPEGGQFQNCATATAAQNAASAPDSNSANNTNICTTITLPPLTVDNNPDLSLAKSCELIGGQSILCTVTVSNIGTGPSISPLSLTDVITGSSAVQYTGAGGTLPFSCTPGAQQINSTPINCSANVTLAAGASGTALFSFNMPEGGEFLNCVSGTVGQNVASAPDPNSANNTNICARLNVPVTPPTPDPQDLSVSKVCEINGAQSILCTVTVTNIGATPSSSPITLTDLVTASSTVNYTNAGGTLPISCSPGAQVINGVPINCTANTSLAPGASGTALFSFTMPEGGRFHNCVSATSGQSAASAPDVNAANNTDICTTLIVPGTTPVKGPDLSVAKSCYEKDGQLVVCSVSVTNQGDANSVAPITLVDLVTGTSQVDLINISASHPVSCTPTIPALINNVPLNCSTQTVLAPSQVFTVDFLYSMPAGGRLYNCVSATMGQNAAGLVDTNAANNTDICATVSVTSEKPSTGTITIIKDARPNHEQDFTFSSDNAAIKPFRLDDDADGTLPNQTTFSGLNPGLYSFTETPTSGWVLTGIECSSGVDYRTDLATGMVTLVLTANSNISCTFTNERRPADTGQICGIKFNDLNGDGNKGVGELGLVNWQIGVNSASIPPVMTNIKGEYCITNLPAGSYLVSEIPQAPWQQTFPSNNASHSVLLAAGQQITGINFGNTIPSGSCSAALLGGSSSLLINGNFEAEQFTLNASFSFTDEMLVSGWETTQADGLMEFWSSGFQSVPAYNGNQFIEVNALTGATVFQNFTVTPGSAVTITFAHRGRSGFPNQMSVAIGPLGGLPVTLGTYTASTTNWTLRTLTYTFPNNGITDYAIGFTALDSSAGGNFLDAISMIDTACETLDQVTGLVPIDRTVLDFLEDKYSDFFRGRYVTGTLDGYNYRHYVETDSYMAIDGGSRIFMLGSFTGDMVLFLATKDDLNLIISKWENGPVSNARLFSFAEANFPEIFAGDFVAGKLDQFDYRYYSQSGNYLAIDNAGMIYVLGPYTNNAILSVGPVESLRNQILIK